MKSEIEIKEHITTAITDENIYSALLTAYEIIEQSCPHWLEDDKCDLIIGLLNEYEKQKR